MQMVVNGETRDITFDELVLSNNLAQESLVRLLVEKGMISPQELLDMMEKVKRERYVVPDEQK